ncbi:hypothetical protein N7493_010197 [Penicillium malachiteum]|uniref:Mid2 domain-containing protein n=1 Tax=Penicillium malachiteum TaxID=1324776 RepID=A0AAD6MRF9_9EURO|nr:hypothetical protein N7493_010197 [Penicillium malachiteum]
MQDLLVSDPFRTSFYTLLLFATLSRAAVPCYLPDGFSETSPEYQPCNEYSNGGTHMCCATNRPNPSGGNQTLGYTADICLQNGLCMNQGFHANGVNWTTFWRESCTSSDWSTGDCLDACAADTNGGNSSDHVILTPCSDSEGSGSQTSDYWCCGQTKDCCDTPDMIHVKQLFAQSVTSISAASKQTPSPTISTSGSQSTLTYDESGISPTVKGAVSTSSPSDSQRTDTESGMPSRVKGAIGGGVTAGILILFALIYVFFFLRRRGKKETRQSLAKPMTKDPVELQVDKYFAPEIRSENTIDNRTIDPSTTGHEIGSVTVIHEKPAYSYRC